MDDTQLWRELGQQFRVDSVRCAAAAKSGHPTSGMSGADLMAVLLAKYLRYDFDAPDCRRTTGSSSRRVMRRRSCTRCSRRQGAISDEQLMTYRQFDSIFEGHPTPRIPWVDVATGSLGQGLPIGVGMAIAGKSLDRLPYRVWVLCGDSETAEGSIWEAFEHAWHYELDNLTAIFDVNRLGQRGPTMDEWQLDHYRARAEAFGWHAIEIDGHDVEAIDAAYAEAEATKGKPTVVIARTIKGKGVKAVENKEGWHGKPLDDPEAAIEELGGLRNIVVEVAKPPAGEPHVFETGALELPRYEVGSEVATRKAYGEALAAARLARGDVVAGRRRGLELDLRGDLQGGAPGAVLRDVHRRAADGRRRGRLAGARLPRVRVLVRRVPRALVRLRPDGGDLARDDVPRRFARRDLDRRGLARRRWRSRTWRRCAPSTARPCSTPATGTRRRSSWRRWPTWTASPTSGRSGRTQLCSMTPTRSSRSAARRCFGTAAT
jgi:transketolase N-terminal domain/subunit